MTGQGGVTFKVYLAERPDGVRYVGCTKYAPEARIRFRYHPIRASDGRWAVWPVDTIKLTVLLTTTDRAQAATFETEMIAHYGGRGPMGANGRRGGGYPVRPYTGPHWTVTAAERRDARRFAACVAGLA
jgi:hypothetical protein